VVIFDLRLYVFLFSFCRLNPSLIFDLDVDLGLDPIRIHSDVILFGRKLLLLVIPSGITSFAGSGIAKIGHGCMSLRRSWKVACVSGFWGLCPRPPPGFCLWTQRGLLSPDSLFSPFSKFLFWLRPCLQVCLIVVLQFVLSRPGQLFNAPYCYSKSSVRPFVRLSVRDVDVPWSYVLG